MNNIICPACGGENPESTKFCMNCGNPLQASVRLPIQPQQPSVEQQQPCAPQQQQPYICYQPAEEPKKMKTWVKVLIIVLAVFVIVSIVGMIFGTEPYTKGEMSGGDYVNTWANIKYTPPEDMESFVIAATDLNEGAEIGYSGGNDSISVIIGFTEQGAGVTAEDVIDGYDMDYALDFTDNATTTKDEIKIAGETYSLLKVTYPETTTNYAVYEYICVRVIDTHSVEILISGLSESDIKEALNSIKTAK